MACTYTYSPLLLFCFPTRFLPLRPQVMITAAMTKRTATITGSMREGSNTDTSLLVSPPSSLNAGGGQLVASRSEADIVEDDGITTGGSDRVTLSKSPTDTSAHLRLVWW